jgi:hypothetical protein
MHRFVTTPRRTKRADTQRGAALLIAIFVLMLISVMATALILMAGTESALKGNYKSAMQAFYYAKAGLEEGRGRLWAGSGPNRFDTTVFPANNPATPMPAGAAAYIINPSSGETVDPTDPTNPYFDSEFQSEWDSAPPVSAPKFLSTWATGAVASPLYKWVRITPRTERSAKLHVDGSGGGSFDSSNPLYFDGQQQLLSSVLGGATTVPGATQGHAWQVLTVTSLAVTSGLLPSRRMVQYTVAPTSLTFPFPAALMLDGPGPTYQAQSYPNFQIKGDNHGNESDFVVPGCIVPQQNSVPAIGTLQDPDSNSIILSLPSGPPPSQDVRPNYTGLQSAPDVKNVASQIPSSLQDPGAPQSLENFVQKLANVATDVVPGPATSLPRYGTRGNPIIAVVNGDLTLPSNTTGYGILVVRGNFNFDGTVGWRGIVLVVGQGVINASGRGDNGEFDGAMFVAKTRDSSGTVLGTLGSPQVNWSNGSTGTGASIGYGVFYDSCWINYAWSALPYQVLSFREIPQ